MQKIVIQASLSARAQQEFGAMSGVRVSKTQLVIPADPRLYEIALKTLDSPVITGEVAEWYQHVTEEEAKQVALKQLPDAPLDAAATSLWPLQRIAVNFLLRTKRAMLCDEPGLGKTATAITAARLTKPNGRVLVVCPASLKYWWASQIARWHPGAYACVIRPGATHGTSNRTYDWATYRAHRSGYLIVNWEALRLMPQLQAMPWQWVLADEAHRVKNRDTQMFSCLKRIRAGRLALITATPFANKPSELWTLLHLIDPERYTSYWRFFEMYTDYSPYDMYRTVRGVKHPEILAKELAPVMIRRTKQGYLLPKTYSTIELDMEPHQEKAYVSLATQMLLELESGEEIEVVNAISKLLRLRQIVSTTATLDQTDYSAKLDALMDLVQDRPDDRFVVFTQFRKTVEAICKRLAAAKISHTYIMGQVGSQEIAKRVAAFQEGTGRVFVATTQTGGVGLTLTAASTLVFIEKHYNPAVQEQAEDRIHRMGQTSEVQIISLLCKDTVDELVERILNRKGEMIDAVLNRELHDHLGQYLKKHNPKKAPS